MFEYIWRNKFITTDAHTINDMIEMLESHVDLLKEMRDDGVTLSDDEGIEDDYACLITDDPKVAEKYGFCELIFED